MRESSTYQAILREGWAKGEAEGRVVQARRMLLLVGRKRLGPPGTEDIATIERITELERIEALVEGALQVTSWDDLLATPG
jgi:predicted transposase YdaD